MKVKNTRYGVYTVNQEFKISDDPMTGATLPNWLASWSFETENIAAMALRLFVAMSERREDEVECREFYAVFGLVCRLARIDTEWANF